MSAPGTRPTLPEAPFAVLSLSVYGAVSPPPRSEWLHCRQAEDLFDPAAVILCAFPYPTELPKEHNLSRYACIRDYHTVVRALLEKLADRLNALFPGEYRPFTDNSPFPEKRLAAMAGLGVIGDNTLLLTREYGSYVFLGELATDVPFLPTGDGRLHSCEHCGRCRAACPGQALEQEGKLEISRCAAAISQKKGELSPTEADILRGSGLAWGCDRCQEACPHNAATARSPFRTQFGTPEPILTEENAAALRESRAFGWRPEAVLQRNLSVLRTCGSERPRKETNPDGQRSGT